MLLGSLVNNQYFIALLLRSVTITDAYFCLLICLLVLVFFVFFFFCDFSRQGPFSNILHASDLYARIDTVLSISIPLDIIQMIRIEFLPFSLHQVLEPVGGAKFPYRSKFYWHHFSKEHWFHRPIKTKKECVDTCKFQVDLIIYCYKKICMYV